MSYRIDVRRFIAPENFKGDITGNAFSKVIQWLADNISDVTENGNQSDDQNGTMRTYYVVSGNGWRYESRIKKVDIGEEPPIEDHFDKIYSLKHTLYLSKFVYIDDPDLAVQFKLSF